MSFSRRRELFKMFVNNGRTSTRCLATSIINPTRTPIIKKRLGTTNFKFAPTNLFSLHYKPYSSFPPHVTVTLPALSPTMELGTIVSWAKKEGDKLNEGDLLAEIETDKATMGFETPEEGYLAKILIPAGSKDVPVGKNVCIVVESEGDIAKFANYKDEEQAKPVKPEARAPPTAVPPPVPTTPSLGTAPPTPIPPKVAPVTEKGRVYASPMAKRLAEKMHIRLEGTDKGSGFFGSLTSKDVESLVREDPKVVSGPLAPPSYVDIPLTNMRTIIAKRLLESKLTVPHYYTTMECYMDDILELRSKLNKAHEENNIKLSVNDFVIKAAALACKKIPTVNSAWLDTVIRQFNRVDINVAVSTEKGLLTPIVFNAENKSLIGISESVKMLAKKARDGKLQPAEFQGGTFTISNLGMYNVSHFCPIINPPQCCILGVGATVEKLVPVNGVGVVKKVMAVTLSADHRAVDGAVAAEWLNVFKHFIENPYTMLN